MTGLEFLAIAGASALIQGLLAAKQSGNVQEAEEYVKQITEQYGPEARAIIDRELGGPSAYEGVTGEKLDPQAVAAQREALRRMQQVAAGGYTPEEEAALRNIQSQTAAQAAAQQATLAQQFQQRGTLGSGAQLAMAQSAGQAAAQRAGMQGLQTAAEAQRRAFQAMQGLGNLGTSVRGQTVAEAQAAAAAEETRKLNRAREYQNVAGTEFNARVGSARGSAEAENLPYKAASGLVSNLTQTGLGYYGAPEDKKTRGQGVR